MSADITKVFQVGCADFCAIWRVDDSMTWDATCVVREAGVFIPPPKRAHILNPAELVAISHPTGDHDEPVLPFPCTLEQMISLASDRGTGDCSNWRLMAWMSARVENLRQFLAWSALNAVADSLFQINQEDAHRLVPHIPPSQSFPTFPCSIDALLEWCNGGERKLPRSSLPSNESIVRLIKERLAKLTPAEGSASKKLRTRERNYLQKVVLAFGDEVLRRNQPDWDTMSREDFYLQIARVFEASGISLSTRSIRRIEKQLKKTVMDGLIEAPVPLDRTLSKILGCVRNFLERQNL